MDDVHSALPKIENECFKSVCEIRKQTKVSESSKELHVFILECNVPFKM